MFSCAIHNVSNADTDSYVNTDTNVGHDMKAATTPKLIYPI